MESAKLNLTYKPYLIELKQPFTIASGSRTTTPVVLTEISYEGITGYGEASMPPYLGETHNSVISFLSKVDLLQFKNPFDLDTIMNYVDSVEPGNYAAKASIDIALHDLIGKLMDKPWYQIWGLDKEEAPHTSFTIGIDKPEIIRQKVEEASEFKILKIKLGLGSDKQIINAVRSATGVPICVDINQGWKDKDFALDMIHWLKEKGCIFVEQPLPKEYVDDTAWLSAMSPLPIIADEAVQRFNDVREVHGIYSGINIKLMKCTGMHEAYKMINLAEELDMKVLLGCMTETSCAISAAAQLSPLADWADLDGALLISNDIFEGVKIINGKITLNDKPGIGVTILPLCNK